MTIVVDASLAVKWFLDEADSDLADAFLVRNTGQMAVPPLFDIEVAATLVREANANKPHASVMRAAIARLVEFLSDGTIVVHPQPPAQLERAAALAIDLGHPLKDCVYLALAMNLECGMITCDARFAEKARGIWAGVRVLGDAP